MDKLSLLLCEGQEHENNKFKHIEENAFIPRKLN